MFIGFFSKLSYSQTSDSSGVMVKYCNKTGYHLDSLTINGSFVGRLMDDSLTPYLMYDSVLVSGGELLFQRMCAKIGNIYEPACFEKGPFGYCGVGVSTVGKGKFEYDIEIKAGVGEFKLYINKHTDN